MVVRSLRGDPPTEAQVSRSAWLTREQADSIARLARIGYSKAYIAMQVGVDRTTVSRALRSKRTVFRCECGRCYLCARRARSAG